MSKRKNKENASGTTLRERVSLTLRGYGIFRKYCPGLAQGKALSALMSALSPFAALWFSSQIINELSGARRPAAVALYAAAVVFTELAMTLLRGVLDRVCAEKELTMWSWFGRLFSEKQMSMELADLENAGIQQQRKQAEENLFMFGNGLAQLLWGTSALVESVVGIAVSTAMTVTLFTSRSGVSALDSGWWAAAVIAGIALGGFFSSRATLRENAIFEKWCAGTVWFNRVFMFYGRELYMSPERAKDVRIYRQDRVAENRLAALAKSDGDKKNRDIITGMAVQQPAAMLVTGAVNALCYLFTAAKAYFGAFGVGDIVRYAGALMKFGDGARKLIYMASENKVYCSHLKKLFDYLDLPNGGASGDIHFDKNAKNVRPGKCELEFDNVSFTYPGSAKRALNGVSLKFNAGERLAVVGMNGSGKTTFIKLLCRLYEPDEGRILLNGVDIREYDRDDYLSLFSVVFQDFKLFSFPVGENVAASVNVDRERAERCLRQAGFGGRLDSMSGGLDTCLYRDFDEAGVEISGGEAQKVAIARALYKDAPFIILDEPTAALDPVAEYEIYSRFNDLISGRSAVYISHRLSSCRFCDSVAVFHEGRLVERGTHDSLAADKGTKYYELWNAQAQYYREGVQTLSE